MTKTELKKAIAEVTKEKIYSVYLEKAGKRDVRALTITYGEFTVKQVKFTLIDGKIFSVTGECIIPMINAIDDLFLLLNQTLKSY